MSNSERIRQILSRNANAKPSEIIFELGQHGIEVSKDLVKKVRLDWRRAQRSVERQKRLPRFSTFTPRTTDLENLCWDEDDSADQEPSRYRIDGRPSYGTDGPVQAGRFFHDLFIKNFSAFLIEQRSETIRSACVASSPAEWFQTEAFAWLLLNRTLVGLRSIDQWQIHSKKRKSDIWIQYAADYESRRGYSIDLSLICNDRSFCSKVRRLRKKLNSPQALPHRFDETNSVRLGLLVAVYRRYLITGGCKYLREDGEIVTPERFHHAIDEELADQSELYPENSALRRLGGFRVVANLDSEPSINPESEGNAVKVVLVGRADASLPDQ